MRRKRRVNPWYEGKTALITGASSGIGQAFAEALAARGVHLILVARSAEKLQTLATHLSRLHMVSVEVLVADLSEEDAATQIYAAVEQQGYVVDILVNCAGFGMQGRFDALSLDRQYEQLLVNIVAPVLLTRAFLPAMLAQGCGIIINVASTTAFQPVPYMAVYGATKAFLRSFTQALWAENRTRGVRMLAVCPGATNTAFFEAIGPQARTLGPLSTPAFVVEQALRAVERRQNNVVPGWRNALLVRCIWRFLPVDLIARVTERVLRSRSIAQPESMSSRDGRHLFLLRSTGDGETAS